jgi:uncharacterized repeat protein (TIGR01451 family)
MRNITRTTYGEAWRASSGHARKPPENKILRCGTWLAHALALFALCAVAVLADEPTPVETTLVAEVRETLDTNDGRRIQRYIPAAVVNQGQVVFYTVQVRNPTSVPVRDAVIVQRIPANTTYVLDSAAGPSADITFSVDGGETFWPQKELVVAKPSTEARRATAQDYTHIRWQLRNALAPGAVALARFQAVFR